MHKHVLIQMIPSIQHTPSNGPRCSNVECRSTQFKSHACTLHQRRKFSEYIISTTYKGTNMFWYKWFHPSNTPHQSLSLSLSLLLTTYKGTNMFWYKWFHPSNTPHQTVQDAPMLSAAQHNLNPTLVRSIKSLLLIKAQTCFDTNDSIHPTHPIKRSRMLQCWVPLNTI
jgi:hypothetical protein